MTTIYLDFDNTIVESNQRVIDIINQQYNESKSESDLLDYGYNSIHKITEEEKLSIFESDEFFEDLQFKPHVIDVITKNYNNFNWVIVTRGTRTNLDKKFSWIDKHWPFKMEKLGINNKECEKSLIDMTDGIQIDDVSCELRTKAAVKILYKSFNDFNWQQINPGDDILIVNSWEDIDKILEFYAKFDVKTLEKRG